MIKSDIDLPETGTDRFEPFDERDVEYLQRLLGKIQKSLFEAARRGNAGTSGGAAECNEERARQQLEDRRRRAAVFGQRMAAEPAWDMLLILYLSARGRQTQSQLGELSGASRTTAMRWIDYLSDRDLVEREAHPTDLRKNFVFLTDKGRRLLDLYLSETG